MMATLLMFTLGWGSHWGLLCGSTMRNVQSVSISYELKVEQELRHSETFGFEQLCDTTSASTPRYH